MSREELAEAVNAFLFRKTQRVFEMNANHIGKYELGEYRWPRAHYREALRVVLNVETDADLGFYPKRSSRDELCEAQASGGLEYRSAHSEPQVATGGVLRRRSLITGLAAIGIAGWGAPAGAESFRHDVAQAVSGRDQVDLAEWERIATEYGSAYVTTGSAALLEDLSVDLTIAQEHLGRLRRASDQHTMHRVIAQLTGLVAHTLSDLGNSRASVRWWRTASQAADASADPTVRTWVRGREIIHGIYDHRPSQVLLDLADQASAITISPFAGLATVYAGRAQTLAILGRQDDAVAALDIVRRLSDRLPPRPEDDPLSVFGWSEVRLRHTESFVHTFLGNLGPAEAAQQAAIALYPDQRSAGCSQVRLHQALCRVRNGDVAQGAKHAVGVVVHLPESQHREMVLEVARQVLRAVPQSERRRPEVQDLSQVVHSPGLPLGG